MEIRETLFRKSFSLETENPYMMAIDFMRRLSDHYLVYERKNLFETDGPVKKATIVFDLIEALDQFSQIRVNFSLESENEMLYVNIFGDFVLKIKEHGLFTEIFTEFYLQNVFPVLRKVSEQRIKELNTELERF